MQIIPTNYWAKLKHIKDADGERIIADWMPIEFHLTDVAVAFEALLETGYSKTLGRLLGRDDLTPIEKKRLTVLAFIHDLGKLNYSFQWNMYRSEAVKNPPATTGHQKEACFFLSKSVEDKAAFRSFETHLHPAQMVSWFKCPQQGTLLGSQLERMLIASFMHHGWQSPDDIQKIRGDTRFYARVMWSKPLKNQREIPYLNFDAALQNLSSIIERHWGEAFNEAAPMDANPAFMKEFNGILNLADWIGSDQERFVFWHDENHFASRFDFAKETVERFLDGSGLLWAPKISDFKAVFGFERNPLQNTIFELTHEF